MIRISHTICWLFVHIRIQSIWHVRTNCIGSQCPNILKALLFLFLKLCCLILKEIKFFPCKLDLNNILSGLKSRIKNYVKKRIVIYSNFFDPVTLTVTAPWQPGDSPGTGRGHGVIVTVFIFIRRFLYIFLNRDIVTITPCPRAVTVSVTGTKKLLYQKIITTKS